LYILSLGFLVWDGKTKDFGLNNSKHSLNFIYSWFHHECHSDLLVSSPSVWLNVATFSNDSLAILIFWFCLEFWWDKSHEFQKCFQQWQPRLTKCIAAQGEYFEGDPSQ
jgi:hypothetical protein